MCIVQTCLALLRSLFAIIVNCVQTRDEASKQLQESKKTGEAQWAAAQKQYQKATPSNQKASKKTWDLAQKARDEVSKALSLLLATKL